MRHYGTVNCSDCGSTFEKRTHNHKRCAKCREIAEERTKAVPKPDPYDLRSYKWETTNAIPIPDGTVATYRHPNHPEIVHIPCPLVLRQKTARGSVRVVAAVIGSKGLVVPAEMIGGRGWEFDGVATNGIRARDEFVEDVRAEEIVQHLLDGVKAGAAEGDFA